MPLFEVVDNLIDAAGTLRRRRYGVIEVAEGRFRRVLLRPFPKISSAPEILLLGRWYKRHRPGDRLRLYYNQPRRFPNFLALKYVVSARDTRMGTLTRALDVLDEIARLKGCDAILCDVGNWRITTKLMARWGWQPHCPSRWHRHYIKRFYGRYPPRPRWIEALYAARDGGKRLEDVREFWESEAPAEPDSPLAVMARQEPRPPQIPASSGL